MEFACSLPPCLAFFRNAHTVDFASSKNKRIEPCVKNWTRNYKKDRNKIRTGEFWPKSLEARANTLEGQ